MVLALALLARPPAKVPSALIRGLLRGRRLVLSLPWRSGTLILLDRRPALLPPWRSGPLILLDRRLALLRPCRGGDLTLLDRYPTLLLSRLIWRLARLGPGPTLLPRLIAGLALGAQVPALLRPDLRLGLPLPALAPPTLRLTLRVRLGDARPLVLPSLGLTIRRNSRSADGSGAITPAARVRTILIILTALRVPGVVGRPVRAPVLDVARADRGGKPDL